ncbi:1-deoxy-D-xylulose-5-phosphate synthase [Lachnoclostridium phytofermentans]|uniref:1-deoxy-D-xylulose-5-phosphate synthase n=1 Tax=Lachnoclostridium phytofermentans (strain ATCC 700394 / DSM 18823 / ISDg) TaxID=357809 RepID=DXS_LACP7|nr:1-deoxy-D-xylulose-5-phosphate synthase [Lachnoclostridium phytofermentans]A9KMB8.1 RecName: Full=1-deoxy-D-xylulose-5-phosphate synthase; AltName: Full=1-deoxyxylulose-5-phosphate synthase; Short=DXP synthase; Short=DXPS [Lachnoclostridium phytofermentans ISDg]ABX42872.1 deoxyxylulose-5-phosphate synthase [Lachnoclostridium phytofermentans ISDg]
MPKILDEINQPNDIKKISAKKYTQLAAEIRRFLIANVSKTGGHLASNLGVVELTMALHLFLDFPEDKLVWDVGHQAYVHKLLTGRKNDFKTLRQYEGMSGFPKRKESDCDAFDTGHSSTSLSVAVGLVKARELSEEQRKVVAVIGDGALSGGMAFEALNNAGRLKENMIIVLNDNNMSISENVGGMSNYLGKARTNYRYMDFKGGLETALKKIPKVGDAIVTTLKQSKDSLKHLFIPGMLFEDMGMTYIGPIDGHNINQMLTALKSASRVNGAVLIHTVTKKGKGYEPAEKEPSKYHGVEPFDIKTGKKLKINSEVSYTEVFGKKLIELAKVRNDVVAITAAMPDGTGLTAFGDVFPNRFFDVGIAEEHAVTFAAGLAAAGFKPVVAVYSTFLQRAYDQILHDVCVGKLPVVFALDRAGIVGNDGETHQGMFDLSYLSHMPGLTVIAPKNSWEFERMLEYCIDFDGPIAIRYPKNTAYLGLEDHKKEIIYGKGELIASEEEIALIAIGSMVETAVLVREHLHKLGLKATLVNARFISPLDEEMLHQLTKSHTLFVTMEENVKRGGFGEEVSVFLCEHDYQGIKHLNISIPNMFVEHGDRTLLKEKLGLDAESIVDKICRQRGMQK